jgi:hypothetical protein
MVLLLVPALTIPSVPTQAQSAQVVDLELALLVDVSASVSDEEFRLQAGGLATAFQSPAVIEAIRAAARKGIVVSIIQWANETNQRVSIDWTMVRGEDDARWLSTQIGSMPRLIQGGHTALSNALAFAMEQIKSNRFEGLRRVIDLSGDGRNNDGLPLRTVRRAVIEQGITINGLAIVNELPLLDRYFRDYLIGGDGAFYIVADDYHAFARAMSEKLVREITSTPLGKTITPKQDGRRTASKRLWPRGGRAGYMAHVTSREPKNAP